MTWIEALILGIVQGLTEFLPVSSSGHLQVFKELLGVGGTRDLTFEVLVHAATVCSTIVVLRKEISTLLQGLFRFKLNEETLFLFKIFISMLPVAIVGLCFKEQVESIFGEGLNIVGTCLLLTACLLAFAYYAKPLSDKLRKPKSQTKADISFVDALIIGISQAIAVLPGLSRSGATIATGILLGNNKEKVAKFSFLMVLVPILGEALLDVVKVVKVGTGGVETTHSLVPLLIGFIAAFITGLLACRWMLNLVAKGNLKWFALYCAALGLLVLVW
ncbi:undecaprenyl-diphosphatase [Bacteroidia bacterium]|nr:undecaprenyl-diphosphatase [Bacteroidia bacterium]